MNGYIWSDLINYIIALIALFVALKANSKVNDHYENDHTDFSNVDE
jgi:hypothetical protein